MRKTILALASLLLPPLLSAQEALKSAEEEYYDFLSLTGQAERPTLGYRTLSDCEWTITDENHIWAGNNLGTKFTLWENETPAENRFANGIDQSVKVRIYGPEWYSSYNTAAPYGQNDGALWQGKGYNTSFTAGARLEAYGFEVTFKPQVSFSQNKAFDLMDNSAYYTNEYAYIWGYKHVGMDVGADAPQRFGDSSFWTYDWSDTEARWSWHTFTVGFGTQSIWLGPAWLNPLLHSNNAATYPKLDIGIRKTEIYMPFFDWDLGAIEGRLWTGYLTESDYFDEDDSNDHNMIHGLSMSYAPSFIPGLTLGANRTCLTKWKWSNMRYIIPSTDNTFVGDTAGKGEDQRASITVDWIFPPVGFEIYGEIGIDDGIHPGPNLTHAMVYTLGAKKSFTISKIYKLRGELLFEWNNTEMSDDYMIQIMPYSFGFHYQITQGYTNRGQWLGSGCGYGGQSQYLGFRLYHKRGNTCFFYHRWQPDNNFLVQATRTGELYFMTYETIGFSADYFITPSLFSSVEICNASTHNPNYRLTGKLWERNVQCKLKLKYNF